MSLATSASPEDLALLYVQQYLQENGYTKALHALEAETQLKYDEDKLDHASNLMQLIWKQLEEQLEVDPSSQAVAEEDKLLHLGNNDFPATVTSVVSGVHGANIISIRWADNPQRMLTGSGDGNVTSFTKDETVLWRSRVSAAAVLSLDVHQEPASGSGRVASGGMDGTVAILCLESGKILATCRPHAKYVIRILWAPGSGGTRLYTASHDQSVSLLALGADGGMLEVMQKVQLPSAVQDIALLPGAPQRLVAGLRDTNYLRLLDCGNLQEVERVNMNQRGDDHVSFFARHFAVSPDGEYLLVCTDAPRMIMFRIGTWQQVRNFYSLPMQKFHQPVARWHQDGAYIFAAADAGQVYIYHVGSAKVAASPTVHQGSNVRDMDYDTATNQLVTCSFDRTVRILTRQG